MKRSFFVAVLLLVASLLLTVALAWSPAAAAPGAPASGGVFSVNSTLDSTAADGVLTFREAILLSQGGTDGVGGLGRGLSDLEKIRLSGCSYTAGSSTNNWHTAVGCGPSATDTITFGLPPLSTIVLSSTLGAIPLINDTFPTIIDGTGITPTINAAGVGSHNGLHISSTGNVVKALTVKNSPLSNFVVDGNSNTLMAVQAINGGVAGVLISANNNTLVSSTISLNDLDGIALTGDFNQLMANAVFSNTRDGLRLSGSAQNNFIGCTNLCAIPNGNEFSANQNYGLVLTGTNVGFNIIQANQIGGLPTYGVGRPGNFFGGMLISGAHDNYLGDAGNAKKNFLDLNGGDGLTLDNGAFNNHIVNNEIGGYQRGNGGFGIDIWGGAHDNTIGGAYNTLGNTAESNGVDCMLVTGSATSANTIQGNNLAFCTTNGLRLSTGTHDNTIGGDVAHQNYIFENGGNGILLDQSANHNTILYNFVGSSGSGANSLNGIMFQSGAHDNVVDSTFVFSNLLNGIGFDGSTTRANVVRNANIRANHRNGVQIANSAHDNLIGPTATTANTITQNLRDGVLIDALAYSNTVAYNFIGTDVTYTSTLSNQGNGITIQGGANLNTIGEPNVISVANVIAFNYGSGIVVTQTATGNNKLYNNVLASNFGNGLLLGNLSFGTAVGFNITFYGNLIRANHRNGIRLDTGTHDNSIDFNWVTQNLWNGIQLDGSATTDNSIALTHIYSNSYDGLNVRNGAHDNIWGQFSVYDNGGLGIDLNAPLDLLNIVDAPYPVITGAALNAGQVTITGTASPFINLVQSVNVEVYGVAPDPSGFGEGKPYLGTAPVSAQGIWTLTISAPAIGCYTALQNITAGGKPNPSEFGPNSCRTFLPLVTR